MIIHARTLYELLNLSDIYLIGASETELTFYDSSESEIFFTFPENAAQLATEGETEVCYQGWFPHVGNGVVHNDGFGIYSVTELDLEAAYIRLEDEDHWHRPSELRPVPVTLEWELIDYWLNLFKANDPVRRELNARLAHILKAREPVYKANLICKLDYITQFLADCGLITERERQDYLERSAN